MNRGGGAAIEFVVGIAEVLRKKSTLHTEFALNGFESRKFWRGFSGNFDVFVRFKPAGDGSQLSRSLTSLSIGGEHVTHFAEQVNAPNSYSRDEESHAARSRFHFGAGFSSARCFLLE